LLPHCWESTNDQTSTFSRDKFRRFVKVKTVLNISDMRPRYLKPFLWFLALYALVIFALQATGEEKFEHLHLGLDTSNAILSMLLDVFLLGERHAIQPYVRNYLIIGFAFAAGTELLHALIGIEWSGWFAWIADYAPVLRPSTWPPSTYVLPLSMAWAYWLMRRNASLSPALFTVGIAIMTLGLFVLSFNLPRYVDTGILGIQRPTQVPLLFLWLGVIGVYWHKRHEHRLFEGLALMGVLLFLSDLCMLYSTSPHEKFTMMAHAGKFIAYALLHLIQMRVAAEDGQARDAAESALFQEKERLREALDELRYQKFALDQHAIVATTDVNGRITYVNQSLCDISGYSKEELLGQDHRLLGSGTHSPDFFHDMYNTISAGKVWSGEVCNRAKNGSLYWLMTTIVPYMDNDNKPTQYIAMRTDITERKLAEAQIYNLAFYDPLTNLPNRRLLNDRLRQVLAASKRTGLFSALMFIDLDNFKPLNDEHGHVVGDLLLVEVARRISSCIRETDTVARFGGDEFVVMLSELGSDKAHSAAQAGMVAEKIRNALADSYTLTLPGGDNSHNHIVQHHCTSSIGVVVFQNQETTSEDALKHADVAMYQAKEGGRNRICFYE
jgi:diguanylate cyclase (GGDEF)-like protein/PAS domain S-box-containing protein